MGKTHRYRWGWIAGGLVGALAVAGVGVLVAAKGSSTPAAATAPEKAPAAVAVTVDTVTLRTLRRTVSVVGTLFGREEISIYSKVDGRVVKLLQDVGDVVVPGQVLLEIDPTDYELAVAEARRSLEWELAKLGLKKLPGKEFDVKGVPTVVRAAALVQAAASKRDRIRQLSGTGAASQEDRETMEKEFSVAGAEHRQALVDAEATLAAARQRAAALDTALQRLADTKIVVPGAPAATLSLPVEQEFVVCKRAFAEGEMVKSSPMMTTALFKIVNQRILKMVATVPERHRAEIKVGQDAEVQVEAYPGEVFRGKVGRVNPSVDRASRTFDVEIHLPNLDGRLSPGSFATVALVTKANAAVQTVPEEAVVSFAGVNKVFVVKDGKAWDVPVRLGATLDVATRSWVEVEGELTAGMTVVTSGLTHLTRGAVVRVRQ